MKTIIIICILKCKVMEKGSMVERELPDMKRKSQG